MVKTRALRKCILAPLLLFLTAFLSGQEYSFTKDFVAGTIILKDSSTRRGQLKWSTSQDEKLRFRENESAGTKKYAPEDLVGFEVDTLKFVSLYKLEVYAEEYPLLARKSKIRQTFGQLIYSGRFSVYLVSVVGYDAMAGAIHSYFNFVFEKKLDSGSQYAAYPYLTRMREKRYEKAKEDLYVFFQDYPAIVNRIRLFKPGDDFWKIIDLMKNPN